MSFIFLLFYIATIYIRPQEWVPAIYAWPLIDILATATAICLFFEIAMRGWARIKEAQNMLLLAFFGCVLMSHMSHTYLQGTIDSFNKFGPNVIMFFLFVNVLNTPRKIKIAIWLIVAMSLFLALESIFQYRNGIGWAGQPMILDRGMFRTTWIGIFNDPNDLALAIVVGIGVLISFIFSRSSIFAKVISIPILGVLSYGLYFTNSRGGYLAYAAMTAYFFMRKFKNKAIAISIGALLAFVIIIIGPSRMSDISAHEGAAFGRIEAWYQGFQMLKSAPLFGVGYGMFADYHRLTAHNSYILVAAEEGLIGFFIWIALIYAVFKGLFKLTRDNTVAAYSLGIEAGLFGFLAASYFLSRAYIALFYVILAVSCALIYTHLRKEDNVFNFKDLGRAGLLSVGILIMVWISMRVSLRLVG